MGEIDFDGPDELYLQLARVLRERIEDGTYPPNRRIPSVVALCREFELANGTVQRALRLLKDEGLLIVKPGKGTFVKPQDEDE